MTISNPGITWPSDQLPGPGHYCFVAAVGNDDDPPPNPANFATFDDFVNHIYAHNNITWRNFNVVDAGSHRREFIPLRFLITGAWDKPRAFALETEAELPEGSRMALQVPHWVGRGFSPVHPQIEEVRDSELAPEGGRHVRIPVTPRGYQALGRIELPAEARAGSHMLVHIPHERWVQPHKIIVRQLYQEREVGRITWLMVPRRK